MTWQLIDWKHKTSIRESYCIYYTRFKTEG